MNIAFDYDNTLDQAYELFSIITQSLIASGHCVYIVTHITEEYRDYRLNQLKEHNIAYTELVITGDKLYECQKRNIDYIFDDCADYFRDLNAGWLQIFKIPPLMTKELEDGYTVECALRSSLSLSGIRNSYQFRTKAPTKKRWSYWKDIHWRDNTTKNTLNNLKSQFNNFKTIEELKKLWYTKD